MQSQLTSRKTSTPPAFEPKLPFTERKKEKEMRTRTLGCFLLVATAVAGWLPERARAAAYTWNSTSGGSWSDTSANGWNTGGGYPSAVGDSATFGQSFAVNTTFTIDVANAIVGALALIPPGSNIRLYVTRTDDNVLTFDAAGAGPATLSWAGSGNIGNPHHDIQAPVLLNDNLVVGGANPLLISGPITGAGKSITVNSGQLRLSGDNSALTGGITINSVGYFESLNSLGGGGSGNVHIAAGAVGYLRYNPVSDANLANAMAKIDPTSAGSFGRYAEGSDAFNYNFSGFPNLRYGPGFRLGVTGGSLTFDFANNGNTYAIGGGGGELDIVTANYFTSGRNLDIAGSQTLRLATPQDYSGNTVIRDASMALRGNGTALNSPAFILNGGGTLSLDNNSGGSWWAGSYAAANLGDRVSDTAPITLNGGTLLLTGSSTANSGETVGPLIFNQRSSYITVNRGGAFTNTLMAESLQRTSQRGIGAVGGNTLGTASFVRFTTAPTSFMVGGGGAAGTTHISIIPWLTDGTTRATRNSFITHDANGLRPLDTATEYASALPDGSVTTQNVRLTAATTMANDTTINSLVFIPSGSATLAFASGKTLTLSSGGMIIRETADHQSRILTIGSSGGTLDLNGREGVFVNTLRNKCYIDAKITNTGGNGLTILGPGTLGITLRNAGNDYTGPTTLLEGMLLLDGNPSEVIPDTSELRLHPGTSCVGNNDGGRETVAGLSGSGAVQLSSTFKFAIGVPALTADTANGVNLQGGFISPGDDNDNPNRTPGTLILQPGGANPGSTDLRIASGTIYLDLASLTSNDMIRVDHGSVTISGGELVLTFLDGWSPSIADIGSTWKIFDLLDDTKTITGTFASTSIVAPLYDRYDTFILGNDLYLRYLGGIPEPTSLSLLTLAGALALRRRRG